MSDLELHQLEDGSCPELEEIIHRQIQAQGGIDFADFMELALYQPEHGYYMTPRRRIGKEGDFFTSSSVHALFGRLIARQLVEMWQLLGGGEFLLAEQGAGEGYLALDILDALAAEAPELYRVLEYRLVEVSPDHRQRQAQRLESHRGRVVWSRFDELSGMTGCFLSNELVDALPVRLVERAPDGWQEVMVVSKDGVLQEELRPIEGAALDEYFRWLGVETIVGNRYEFRSAARRWMMDVAGILVRGFVITIDYGYLVSELYAPWRRSGTLMCYHRHQTNEDPFRNIGHQDITAHVDFSALQKSGADAGLVPLYYAAQYRFLMALGFVEELLRLEACTTDEKAALALRMTLKTLIMPEEGMGETFKVLIQGKGVGQPDLLCNRRIGTISLTA